MEDVLEEKATIAKDIKVVSNVLQKTFHVLNISMLLHLVIFNRPWRRTRLTS